VPTLPIKKGLVVTFIIKVVVPLTETDPRKVAFGGFTELIVVWNGIHKELFEQTLIGAPLGIP
jgi:hypothetical protein